MNGKNFPDTMKFPHNSLIPDISSMICGTDHFNWYWTKVI